MSLKHGYTVKLQTERLLLRPFQLSDAEDLLAHCSDEDEYGNRVFASDEEYAQAHLVGTVTRQAIETILSKIVETPWHDHPRFAIVANGTVIGEAELKVDYYHLVGELAYGIARIHWGKGLATEAARAVVGYGFSTLGLARVFAWLDPRNVRSMRVLEKLGMRREGLLRSSVMRRDGRGDSMIYGLLREEWEAMQ